MNDFDDVTFARFARRFAEIEHVVPGPPERTFPSMMQVRTRAAALRRTGILIGAVLLLGAALGLAAIGFQPSPTPTPSPTPAARVTIPPDSAAPDLVLGAYLSALVARDCDTAEQFIDSPIYRWSDMLCGGAVTITDFSLIGEPRREGYNKARLDALLTTDGRSIGLPADQGRFTFDLQQRTSGAWRIIDAYPWPITLFPTRPPT
jgi:hypothetical protein